MRREGKQAVGTGCKTRPAVPAGRIRHREGLARRCRRRTCLLATMAVVACDAAQSGGQEVGGAEPSARPDSAAVFEAMDSVYARFTRAYALAEPESVTVLYTDDPLYLPGQGEVLTGAGALRAQFEFLRSGVEDGSVRRIRFESVERGASGELAYDVGYYILHREAPDGSAGPPTRGKFVTVWQRQEDGAWKIHVDGFSPAGPPPG